VSAKRDATKAGRLAQLIASSAEGKVLPQYTWQRKREGTAANVLP
jgi:hypothetical protein